MTRKNSLGAVAVYGLIVLLSAFGLTQGSIASMLADLWLLMSGRAAEIQRVAGPASEILPMLALVVPVGVLLSLSVLPVVRWLAGAPHRKFPFEDKAGGYIYCFLFVFVFVEELFARFLFLGVLAKLSASPVWLYLMILTGNALWAFVHVYNYRPGERQVIRVLPQFIFGIVFTYVFLRFGFLAAVLGHFVVDVVLISYCKLQELDVRALFRAFVSGAVVLAAWLYLDRPAAEALAWLDGCGFALAGWGFGQYAALACLVAGLTKMSADLLLFDTSEEDESVQDFSSAAIVVISLAAALIQVVVAFAGYYVCWWAGAESTVAAVFAAVLVPCLVPSPSPSAAMRMFWTCVPEAFVCLAVCLAYGFWAAVGVGVVIAIVHDVPRILIGRFVD